MLLIVEDIDDRGKRGRKISQVPVSPTIELLRLQGLDEALTVGVIGGGARTAHADHYAERAQPFDIGVRSVLYSTIGVMHPRGRPAF